ncbi:hypothetical protein [Pelosinus baikalensis]|uniref:Uncharacterized protein n=1 Tax=Pelosinus baikalensis TaxID=2892015 RepID=A0ABS8HT72_9FIRM|nr:hypothetical protein [Pelosinus baikalensis]MCC5465413.1 hypothetical protein [Pelosinus baikalensis]
MKGNLVSSRIAYIFEFFSSEKRMVATTWITTEFLAAGIIGQIISSAVITFVGASVGPFCLGKNDRRRWN